MLVAVSQPLTNISLDAHLRTPLTVNGHEALLVATTLWLRFLWSCSADFLQLVFIARSARNLLIC
jgi:hypothetical protein